MTAAEMREALAEQLMVTRTGIAAAAKPQPLRKAPRPTLAGAAKETLFTLQMQIASAARANRERSLLRHVRALGELTRLLNQLQTALAHQRGAVLDNMARHSREIESDFARDAMAAVLDREGKAPELIAAALEVTGLLDAVTTLAVATGRQPIDAPVFRFPAPIRQDHPEIARRLSAAVLQLPA